MLSPTTPLRHDNGSARTLQERALFERYVRLRHPHTRSTLIERYLPLARSVARRYEHPGEPLEDLVQVASLALIKAVDRFEPARGHAFTSFAVPTIVGELKRYLRDRTWIVRPPRGLQELALRVDRAMSELAHQLDRPPTVSELARAVGLDDEHVVEALLARSGRSALSLQAAGTEDDSSSRLEDELGADDGDYELAETRVTLHRMLALLPAREREVLRLRFQEDMTQGEIGARIGVSQMQVSRIIRGATARLREIADQQARLVEGRQRAAPRRLADLNTRQARWAAASR
jgi:RNA polymerase sigma-B factor